MKSLNEQPLCTIPNESPTIRNLSLFLFSSETMFVNINVQKMYFGQMPQSQHHRKKYISLGTYTTHVYTKECSQIEHYGKGRNITFSEFLMNVMCVSINK